MNAFDREFWNGALKASIMIEKDLKKLLEEVSENEKEGIKIAIARVREIKENIETLHGNSVLRALKEIEMSEEIQ
jgi:spermidine/putrescine-binding protein